MGPVVRSPMCRANARESRCQRDDGWLAALANDLEGALSALKPEIIDVDPERLWDPQAVAG
jgi:hypothetical protein